MRANIAGMAEAILLHLSDIHRTRDEPVRNEEIILSLLGDIDRYAAEGLPSPNVVVISGDLTQSAQTGEYEEAAAFIRELLSRLALPTTRLVVVPGNHDINWDKCYEIFQLRPTAPAHVPRDLCFELAGDLLCPISEDAFESRLDNFREFHRHIFGTDYPRERNKQYSISIINDLGIAFAGFNSCELLSHKRHQGKINVAAIHQAVTELETFHGDAVAVWHHDMNWRGDACQDALDIDSLRFLSERCFDFGLCGHTHRPETHDIVTMGGLSLPVIAAGSLCAGPRQRPESVPRAYNLIEVRPSHLRVHVRVKPEKSAPWRCSPVQTRAYKFENWFDVQRDSDATRATVATGTWSSQTARVPTPFAVINAKATARDDLAKQFVWTDVAKALDCDNPQIIVGPRGAGKTALLLSLTFETRLAAPHNIEATDVLARLGLMCSMNVAETTAFNSKGWLDEGERKRVFVATIGTIWAQELIHTLEKVQSWARSRSLNIPVEESICGLIAQMLAADPIEPTFASLSRWTKGIRSQLVLAIGQRDDQLRADALNSLFRHPITRGTAGLLADIAGELARAPALARTRWILLFDEVEYLNDWQQDAVYSFLKESSPYVVAKLATLPYAHERVIRSSGHGVIDGNDYMHVALNLTAELELQTGDDRAPDTFIDLATRLWKNRLAAAGLTNVELAEVWPDAPYEDVVSSHIGRTVRREELEIALVQEIADEPRRRAESLRTTQRPEFLDQYWRKYAQPFRIRYAERLKNGDSLPLIWGWKALLRACDGNCRWFLRLADQCWTQHWAQTGLRALSAKDQYACLRVWSEQIYRVIGTMTKEGPILKDVVDRASADLRARLVGLRHLVPEALSFHVRDLSPEQSEAIAVGVALGYLVPRVDKTAPVTYPTTDVELRMGFPVAVYKRLPLRSGAVIKIGDLKQVAFQWLKD